ncbi:MAG: glycosyltransferase family 4 protein [Muribaculaceae bacterium]|nr:glycosyltransferase family 4 protein [Muribaculaceae bacterium]
MRIIHVLSSVMWSGVERYALDICRYCRDHGDDVLVVTRDARAVDDVFRRHGIDIRFAPLGGFLSYHAVKGICDVLDESREATALHCHSTRDAFAALTARRLLGRHDIRVVLTRHYVRRAGRSPFHRFVYRNVDRLIFVSELAREKFYSSWHWKGRYDEADINDAVIHNSLNIELDPVAEEPAKGPVIAMYLGRLAPDKGLEDLIDALVILKNMKLRLRIVGTGHPDYVDSLRRRALTAGVMHMIDWPRHKENTEEYIRMSHFGVLPSVGPEAFGLSNIEFMKEGRPIICSDNGAQPEYIRHGKEGILVSPHDPQLLAVEMRRLALSGELRKEIGCAARRRFELELAWPRFIERLYPMYRVD